MSFDRQQWTDPEPVRVYIDPNAVSLDGATDAENTPYDHESPWSWPHRWRPSRKANT